MSIRDLDRSATAALTAAFRATLRLPAYRPGGSGKVPVPSLPTETDLRLGGVNLNDYLGKGMPTLDDPVRFFELFLEGVLFPDPDNVIEWSPFMWFVRESRLTFAQARCLLPPGATLMDVGTVILWLCARGLPSSDLAADRYTVTSEDGYLIGFADGYAISEFPRMCQRHPPCDFARTLATRTIKRIGFSRTRAFNAAWIRVDRYRGPEREALRLALQILYWRAKNTIHAVEYLYGV